MLCHTVPLTCWPLPLCTSANTSSPNTRASLKENRVLRDGNFLERACFLRPLDSHTPLFILKTPLCRRRLPVRVIQMRPRCPPARLAVRCLSANTRRARRTPVLPQGVGLPFSCPNRTSVACLSHAPTRASAAGSPAPFPRAYSLALMLRRTPLTRSNCLHCVLSHSLQLLTSFSSC